jgi:CRISPR-associated protein Csx10
MTLHFTVSVKMTSDWHIGSGQGRHRSIDRLIDRDWDGLPFIPAATLRGVWRDSAQLLARGLDDGQAGSWTRFAELLFGSEPMLDKKREDHPTASLVTLDDARFPDEVRNFFLSGDAGENASGAQKKALNAGKKALREALTFIKPGVSIDERSGAAKTDFLRFEEVARAGAVLEAKGAVDCTDAGASVVAAFLAGAAALTERLGGKRRRGMGKCVVTVEFAGAELSADAAAGILEATQSPPELAQPARSTETRVFPVGSGASGWKKIALRVTLLSPLIAADEVQGNVITCQDHIPSGLLLAPVAGRLDDAGVANVWTLIAGGDVRILPATPEIDGRRSLPVPFCWEEEKGKKAEVVWEGQKKLELKQYGQIPRTDDANPGKGNPQQVSVKAGFVSQFEPLQHKRAVAKVLRTHNTIKDDIQRPHEDVGGVYTYEALAAGQIFRSEIWIRGADIDAARLSGRVRLGRARQAGYGLVEIEALEPEEAPPVRQAKPGFLRVWLTSDAILPSPMGMGGLETLADEIAGVLGRKPEDLFIVGESWASLRWRRVDGWQSRWDLPRPTLIALQSGSVAELKVKAGAIDIDRLEREGIGARRGEGFGCVLANHQYLAIETKAVQVKIERPKPPANKPQGQATAFIETIYRRAWERCIALRAEMAVSKEQYRKDILGWKIDADDGLRPSMSQLGALRAVISELSGRDFATLQTWMKRLGDAKKWDEGAFKALKTLLTADQIWQTLEIIGQEGTKRFAGAPRPATDGFDPASDGDLRRFAIRTLLLEAMHFHKRDGEKKKEVA